MAYWLVKSEPDAFAWDELVKRGAKGEPWTGVRNHTAKLNLMKMKKGDRAFYYHSNEGKEIVGIAEVTKSAYPDSTDKEGKSVTVDFKAVEPVKKKVTLAEIKADPKFKEMKLVRQSRLSVSPVSDEHWKLLLKMASGPKSS
jgi:predicted RNA-binding protein with PUA-like domain